MPIPGLLEANTHLLPAAEARLMRAADNGLMRAADNGLMRAADNEAPEGPRSLPGAQRSKPLEPVPSPALPPGGRTRPIRQTQPGPGDKSHWWALVGPPSGRGGILSHPDQGLVRCATCAPGNGRAPCRAGRNSEPS